MLLSASIIATWASVDYSVENQVLKVKKSRNLDFGQKVKNDFDLHICCHGNDLSNITNWQHIGGASLTEISVEISAPRALGHSIFICGVDFFHLLIKSSIFVNKNNFCCF